MPETVTATSDFAAAPISLWRRGVNAFATFAAGAAVVLVLLPLGAVFGYLIYKGIGSINWAFLTQTPKPVGEAGGGMANAIAGSAFILLIASAFGVPIGIGAGIYLAEYGRNQLGNVIRFTADVLNGVPSIVVGIVAYGIVVLSQGHFSALAGGVALAHYLVDYLANRHVWRNHRCDAGLCARCWRDGPASFHRIRQPVLELENQSADGRSLVADFHLRDFALR